MKQFVAGICLAIILIVGAFATDFCMKYDIYYITKTPTAVEPLPPEPKIHMGDMVYWKAKPDQKAMVSSEPERNWGDTAWQVDIIWYSSDGYRRWRNNIDERQLILIKEEEKE